MRRVVNEIFNPRVLPVLFASVYLALNFWKSGRFGIDCQIEFWPDHRSWFHRHVTNFQDFFFLRILIKNLSNTFNFFYWYSWDAYVDFDVRFHRWSIHHLSMPTSSRGVCSSRSQLATIKLVVWMNVCINGPHRNFVILKLGYKLNPFSAKPMQNSRYAMCSM